MNIFKFHKITIEFYKIILFWLYLWPSTSTFTYYMCFRICFYIKYYSQVLNIYIWLKNIYDFNYDLQYCLTPINHICIFSTNIISKFILNFFKTRDPEFSLIVLFGKATNITNKQNNNSSHKSAICDMYWQINYCGTGRRNLIWYIFMQHFKIELYLTLFNAHVSQT